MTSKYVPLTGEGKVEIIERTRCRHECTECGEPADFRHSHLLDGARRNPASSAYRRDDCYWCSDAETYSCAKHESNRNSPDGHSWCSTFALLKYPHMGLYWRDKKLEVQTT